MIRKFENDYLISSYSVWRPGIYDSERAAKYAFRFSDSDLQELQDSLGEKPISFEMLQNLRKKILAR